MRHQFGSSVRSWCCPIGDPSGKHQAHRLSRAVKLESQDYRWGGVKLLLTQIRMSIKDELNSSGPLSVEF